MQSIYFYDIELFVEDICRRWTSDPKTGKRYECAEFQKELRQLCKEPVDLLAVIARDHAKTTSVSKILTLWFLLYEIEPSILFIMSKGLGEETVGDIRRELETNPLIRLIYGQLVPVESRKASRREKWRQRELQLLNNTELKAITKGEPIRGRRPTKVVVDDPQENKDVKNPAIADEFNNWIWTAVYPVLSTGGSMVVLGTIIANICFVNVLKQEALARSFRVVEYPAVLNCKPDDIKDAPDNKVIFPKGARALWPQKWTLEKLAGRYAKIGRRPFMQEYLNVPFVLNSSPVFSAKYSFKVLPVIKRDASGVVYFRAIDKTKRHYIGVDIANGRVGGDFSAFTCRDEDFKLVAQFKGWIAQHLFAKLTADFCTNFEQFLIIPENNIGLAYINALKDYPAAFNAIYKTRTFDKVTQKETEILGWNTNSKTKPIMINTLDKIMRAGEWQVSEELKSEILYYYYDEKGGMNALAPYHDDILIADALTTQGCKKGVPDIDIMFI